MSYHDLSECTLTPQERFHEKNEILKILGILLLDKEVPENELKFLQSMAHAANVSVKQLFYLRDIKEKYL